MKRAMHHKKNHSVLYTLLLLYSTIHQTSYASSSHFEMKFYNNTNHTVLLYRGKGRMCVSYQGKKSAVIPPKAPPYTMTFDQYKSCHNVESVVVVAIKDKNERILCASNIVFYMKKDWKPTVPWRYKLDFGIAPKFPSKTPKCQAKNIAWMDMFKSYKSNGKHKVYGLEFNIEKDNHIKFSPTKP